MKIPFDFMMHYKLNIELMNRNVISFELDDYTEFCRWVGYFNNNLYSYKRVLDLPGRSKVVKDKIVRYWGEYVEYPVGA